MSLAPSVTTCSLPIAAAGAQTGNPASNDRRVLLDNRSAGSFSLSLFPSAHSGKPPSKDERFLDNVVEGPEHAMSGAHGGNEPSESLGPCFVEHGVGSVSCAVVVFFCAQGGGPSLGYDRLGVCIVEGSDGLAWYGGRGSGRIGYSVYLFKKIVK